MWWKELRKSKFALSVTAFLLIIANNFEHVWNCNIRYTQSYQIRAIMIYDRPRNRASFVLPSLVNPFAHHIWYIRWVLFDQQDDDYSFITAAIFEAITVIINRLFTLLITVLRKLSRFIIQYINFLSKVLYIDCIFISFLWNIISVSAQFKNS